MTDQFLAKTIRDYRIHRSFDGRLYWIWTEEIATGRTSMPIQFRPRLKQGDILDALWLGVRALAGEKAWEYW